MATAPKCKVCGSNHFGAAHVWPTSAVTSVPQKGVKSTVGTGRVIHQSGINTQGDVMRPPSQTFDRVAYQREYMRKRRAEAEPGSRLKVKKP